jgi:hypothetical protein
MSSYAYLGEFDVGERVRFRVTYRDPDTLAKVDPLVVECTVWLEGSALADDAPVMRDEIGVYSAYFIPESAGDHYVEVVSTGDYAEVQKGMFHAVGSVIPS